MVKDYRILNILGARMGSPYGSLPILGLNMLALSTSFRSCVL